MGRLEVITGPMYSGKSEELIRRIVRHEIAGRKTIILKPEIDDRDGKEDIISRSGSNHKAYPIEDIGYLEKIAIPYDVIGLDEAQFFDADDLIEQVPLAAQNKIVIIAGLDMTYRKEPFSGMPYLLALAQKVDKLTAVCHTCGEDAIYTQRLIDGEPASFSGPTVQIGGEDGYEARCAKCFEFKA